MTLSQSKIIAALNEIGPARCSELAEHTGITSTKCSEVLGQLVRKKMASIVGGNASYRLYQVDAAYILKGKTE